MSKQFLLPDLGEGLPDATIVEWHVKVGDTIRLDENLVSMETAKAVVDVPSPVSGKVLKLAGAAGDIIVTGTMLAEFEIDPSLPQRAEGQDTGHHHGGGHGPGTPDASDGDRVVASSDRDDFLERWRRVQLRTDVQTFDLPGIVHSARDGGLVTLTVDGFGDDFLARLGTPVQHVQRMSLEEIFVATVMHSREARGL